MMDNEMRRKYVLIFSTIFLTILVFLPYIVLEGSGYENLMGVSFNVL